jgi:uncharacterized lipoprotein YehR (DUF1307 family)
MKMQKWLLFCLMVALSVAMSVGIQGCGKKDTSSTFYGAAS